MNDEAGEFSWTDDDSVVIKPVSAIAVYTNPLGDVVIRQEGHDDGSPYSQGDQIVVVPRGAVDAVIAAINKEIED